MTVSSSERSGLVLLRVWIEPGHEKGLRARLTGTVGGSGREVSIATAATVQDAVESVRSWLEDFVASQATMIRDLSSDNAPLTPE
jgi:hypothetical protein